VPTRRQRGREVTVDGLQAGQEWKVRFNGVSLKKGSHELTARVDSKSGVSETDEENNRLRKEIDCKFEG
jgi:subtilase family serine protease